MAKTNDSPKKHFIGGKTVAPAPTFTIEKRGKSLPPKPSPDKGKKK